MPGLTNEARTTLWKFFQICLNCDTGADDHASDVGVLLQLDKLHVRSSGEVVKLEAVVRFDGELVEEKGGEVVIGERFLVERCELERSSLVVVVGDCELQDVVVVGFLEKFSIRFADELLSSLPCRCWGRGR